MYRVSGKALLNSAFSSIDLLDHVSFIRFELLLTNLESVCSITHYYGDSPNIKVGTYLEVGILDFR